MVLSAEQRNGLIDLDADPSGPTPPDLGVAIRLDRDPPHYPQRSAVILHGAYRADGALLERFRWSAGGAITLTLKHTGTLAEMRLRLLTRTGGLTSPNDAEAPAVGPDYRQRGQFRVDLRRFFEIPDHPGRYTVRAALDEHTSETLWFEIVDERGSAGPLG